jgi:hypothetical protein
VSDELVEDEPLLDFAGQARPKFSCYDFGPRETTDKWFGVGFVLSIVVAVIWGIINVASGEHAGDRRVWTYNASHWKPDGTSAVQGDACVWDDNPAMLLGDDLRGEPRNVAAYIATPIALAVVAAFLLGILVLVGFRHIPKVMTWTVVVIKVVCPALLAIVLLIADHGGCSSSNDDGGGGGGGSSPDESCARCKDCGGSSVVTVGLLGDIIVDDGTSTCSSGGTLPTYIPLTLFGTTIVLGILAYVYREVINMVARMFQIASVAVKENWILIPVQIAIMCFTVFIKVSLIVLMVFYFCTINVVYNPHANWDGSDGCEIQFVENWYTYCSYVWFVLAWFVLWSLTTRTYVVADTVSCWYWHGHGDEDPQATGKIQRALKNGFTSHFGTMAFAALVLWFVDYLKKKVKAKTLNPLVCVLKCIARCILSLIEFLTKMAVLVCAIRGQNFFESGKKVVNLFTATCGNMKLASGVWVIPPRILNFFVFICSIMYGLATGFTVYAAWRKNMTVDINKIDMLATCGLLGGDSLTEMTACSCTETLDSWGVILAIVMGLVSWIICAIIMAFLSNILLTVVDTVFMCFLFDKENNQVSKPELHEIMMVVLDRNGNKVQVPAGAPAQAQIQQVQPVMVVAPVTSVNAPPPPAYTSQPKFDPNTGQPIQPVAAAPQQRFDPMTGQPIQQRFDPMTGQPM